MLKLAVDWQPFTGFAEALQPAIGRSASCFMGWPADDEALSSLNGGKNH